MDFYYINNRGQKIDLSDYPYIFQSGDLLNWKDSYTTRSLAKRDITSDYKLSVKEIPVQIAVLCDFSIPLAERKEEWKEAVDHLADVLQADVVDGKAGRIYTDTGYYMNCKIIGSEKSNWKMGLPFMFNTMTILADRPIWIHEESRSFPPISSGTRQDETYLDYEHDYPYDYTMPHGGDVIWKVDHFAPCEFLMTIFGPAVDPRIVINGHPYQVYTTLDTNEYLQIDSRNNRVIKYLANGIQQDIYDLRAKQESVFDPITPGNISVVWPGDFGFDLTLFCERSEPRWKTRSG